MRLKIFNSQIDYLKTLLIVNGLFFVLAFLLQSLTGEFNNFDLDFLLLLGVFNTKLVQEGNIWIFITSCFVHFDLLHFLFNIYALYSLGKIVKQFYGERNLFTVYIFAGLAGSIFTYTYSVIFDSNISTLGASGAIFGLLGLLVGASLKKDASGRSEIPIDIRSFYPTLLVAVVISLLPQINLWAHLGGFLTGLLLSRIIVAEYTPVSINQQKIINILFQIAALLFIISIVAFITSFFNLIFIVE